ncbi:uncharacterized protein [Primulina huaijiensis]|uniref:uncharacterized protein n=1 Tax=Primulina huaijiensis TaxID=1492673 RepID=UPI003CC6FB83
MGNAIITSPACIRPRQGYSAKLISQGGATRTLTRKTIAGEIMFDFPDRIVCHADSFFIGQPIPALAIEDELIRGQTYFLIPADFFQHDVLSVSSLAAMASLNPNSQKGAPTDFKECPFEYLKGSDGRVLIKVAPTFITRLINGEPQPADESEDSFLCSTPELKQRYNQLVRPKDQGWSPKLETISECRSRVSPCRIFGLERKQKGKAC